MDKMKVLELFLNGLVTLGTAYAGARFAFKFNRQQHDDAMVDARIEECNRAMLALLQQFSTLVNYRKQHLEAHRAHPGRHFQVQASPPFETSIVRPNVAALAFLLSTDARDVPAEIALLDNRYRSCLELINLRSRMHFEEYQPILQAHVDRTGSDRFVEGEALQRAVGARITGTMRSATDDIYDMVDSAIMAFIEAGAQLRRSMKAVYPGANIIGFEPIPSTSAPHSSND